MNYIIIWMKSYFLFISLCLGTVVGIMWLYILRDKMNVSKFAIPFISISNSIAGLICVKLFAGLENLGSPIFSGQSLYGAIFLLPIFYFIWSRVFQKDVKVTFDVLALCTISTLLFARLACIVQGCCYGKYITNFEPFRWPTRELEIVFYIILLVYFFRVNKSNEKEGFVWPLYMIFYGIFRFIEEWMREGTSIIGPFHISHIWSILSVIIGIAIYTELNKGNQSKG